jgi:hypothetical protein
VLAPTPGDVTGFTAIDIRTGGTPLTTSIEKAFLDDTAYLVIVGGNIFLPAFSVMST